MNLRPIGLALGAAALLAGCSNLPARLDAAQRAEQRDAREQMAQKLSARPEDMTSAVQVHDTALLHLHKVNSESEPGAQAAWLRRIRLSLAVSHPLSAKELVRMLRDKGINVTTNMPLDNIVYNGLGVNNVDGETALQMLLGAMGLDYAVDNVHHVVRLQPMQTKTWTINIGRRISDFQSVGCGDTLGNNCSGSGSTNGGVISGGGGGGGSTGYNSAGAGGGGKNVQNIQMQEDFWKSLKEEIESRLTLLVPTPRPAPNASGPAMPALPMPAAPGAGAPNSLPLPPSSLFPVPAQGAQPANNAANTVPKDMFTKQQFGTYSVNPDTGAVTVQAPHWLLAKLDRYLTDVQAMYNADITFQGELLMLTTDKTDQEGLDIQAFGRYAANNYGAVYTSTPLGVTINFAGGVPTATGLTGTLPIASPLLGAALGNSLQVFNGYLSKLGNVKVLQKPVLATTTGMPGIFARTTTIYYNLLTQTAASGGTTGSATVATNNSLVPVEIGTVLRINPRYDVRDNLIRAQIQLRQDVQNSTQRYDQYLSNANGSQTIVPTDIPVVTRLNYSGEALLHDGDLIVIGGMHEDAGNDNGSGITGTVDTPVAGLFGNRAKTKSSSTYYFALKVSVRKK